MKRRTKIILGIVILVVAAVVTAGFVSRRGKDVTAVTKSKVERMDLTSKVTANGRIDAKRKVDLSANVMGQIVNLAVREGDVVKKGAFLLRRMPAAKPCSIAGRRSDVDSTRDRARSRAVSTSPSTTACCIAR